MSAENAEIIATKPPKNASNKEQFQRINYLYQLSMHYKNANLDISRTYVNLLDTISKKTNTKISPNIKRSYCKKCKRLIDYKDPKMFKVVKSKNKKNDKFIINCKCGSKKTFPIGLNRDYKTYTEKEGNLLEI
ncbi:hypothetical protein TPHA_0I02060 [Tetrapisispora phaffii CBS 4417]|uniref:Uncharacterized protein n=1 Tax=Tetrapisispora phaffii (strain ATCC 24235 / CBS 4417 / NBRC 1672 / NRRL Y-8282 / UCD 70-5) TaxID=1071381 RepID=G8BXT2_TETPH|nr:hypothetical protein TPHA_0I02060 [Tetrapisispora phaffii CBS 4417]CCE64710.1 hypothetical protein TPHA_0I02060 [Tetrapisispora phaffii CBS 4417]